jgi:hypothetical protein
MENPEGKTHGQHGATIRPQGLAKGGMSQHTKCYAVIDKEAGISYVSTSDGKLRGFRLLDGEDRIPPSDLQSSLE